MGLSRTASAPSPPIGGLGALYRSKDLALFILLGVSLTLLPWQAKAQKLVTLCLQVSNVVNGVKTTSCVPISAANPLPVTTSGSGTATSPGSNPLAICVQRSSVVNGSSCVPVSAANPLPVSGVSVGGGGGNAVPFTALHTYYLAANGNDACNGTSAAIGSSGNCAWLTPNHAVVCGDVIVAAPGTHNQNFSIWGTVSSCPSVSGGIDGTGGVYFATLLCGGPFGASGCVINCATAACAATVGNTAIMNVNKSNWAVEGWTANGNGAANGGLTQNACATNTTITHHVAFINNIVYNAGWAYGAEDCALTTTNVPGNGPDYWAVVGNIAQNANQLALCTAAIVDVGPANFDAVAGTHVFIAGNFAMNNSNNPFCTSFDGEAIMFDTPNAHAYTGATDIENNIIYDTSAVGIQLTAQATRNNSVLNIQIHNNTLFADMQCPYYNPGPSGELNYNFLQNLSYVVATYNNIARPNKATQPYGTTCASTSSFHPYAMVAGGNNGVTNFTLQTGGAGIQNIFWGLSTVCDSGVCESSGSNQATSMFNGFTTGTDTIEDPAYANTPDLLTNWVGIPSCAAYTNTAACMGWNYSGQTATALTPIADLVPTAAGTSGKGYQSPGACVANSLFPTWLKGIVFLQWNGTSITENAGLVTKPCGL